MSDRDIKIINAPIVTQSFLKNLPGNGDGNKVNIVMVTNITQENHSDLYPNPFQETELPFDFEMFLESLDPPRLKTLIDMAVRVALKKNGTMRLAEDWLGGEKMVGYHRREGLEHIATGGPKKYRKFNCDKETLIEVLQKHNWSHKKTGEELGMPPQSVGKLIAYHCIKKEEIL